MKSIWRLISNVCSSPLSCSIPPLLPPAGHHRPNNPSTLINLFSCSCISFCSCSCSYSPAPPAPPTNNPNSSFGFYSFLPPQNPVLSSVSSLNSLKRGFSGLSPAPRLFIPGTDLGKPIFCRRTIFFLFFFF